MSTPATRSKSTPKLTSAAELLSRGAVPSAQWRPGLGGSPCHAEVFSASREASGAGLALALAGDGWRDLHSREMDDELADVSDERSILWVQDARAAKLGGLPYRAGLPEDWRRRLIHVLAPKPADALFALEEGVRCRDLAFVIGELSGNPRELDFTASRRLTLAAERHGVPLYLVRLDARRDLSAARMRWEVASAPSPTPRWNAAAPGMPAWQAELFRSRRHRPGRWTLHDERRHDERGAQGRGGLIALAALARAGEDNAAPDPCDLAAGAGGRSLEAGPRA